MKKMVQAENKDQNFPLTIGRKIRELRKSKGLTIRETALNVGLSVGLISQIENEQVTPAIATLLKLSSFLGVDITYFFQAEAKKELFTVVRKEERVNSSHVGLGARPDLGYHYEALAYKEARKHMEPFIVTFDVREKNDMVFFSHEGEEFIHVMQGRLEFCIEDKNTILEENDSLYFDSDKLHGYRPVGAGPCKALVVIYKKMPEGITVKKLTGVSP